MTRTVSLLELTKPRPKCIDKHCKHCYFPLRIKLYKEGRIFGATLFESNMPKICSYGYSQEEATTKLVQELLEKYIFISK